ncbi:MAG: type III secretion system chaperone [Victivallales bacterium]|nr:type III secretion system chaperone [Victivallales bacterium]
MNRLQRLADMAVIIASEEAVETNEIGFTLNVQDVHLMFFAPNIETAPVYCRALIGSFGKSECPGDFAEAALTANFFWRATEGATLSLNEQENAVYLTDRFDEEAFENEKAFTDYINTFLRNVYDWQLHLANYINATEAMK